jgi:peptidoglycan/LPS O-acetylase OafA/YrhL
MGLFFVLSGFVMWLNYAHPIAEGQPGALREFLLARFARLYPMYLVVILVGVGATWAFYGWPSVKALSRDAIYFLTLSETWLPQDHGHMIVQGMPYITHLWSISTETFFYLIFPIIVITLARAAKDRIFSMICLNLVLGAAAFYVVLVYSDQIMAIVAPGMTNKNGWAWLTYFSPYLRICQFIAGCLSCHLYLSFRHSKPTKREIVFGYVAAFSMLAVPVISEILRTNTYPITCALILQVVPLSAFPFLFFFLARHESQLGKLVSWRPIVAGGEISYSLYLLHPLVIGSTYWTLQAMHVSSMLVPFIVISATVSCLASMATYRLIELPAKRWIRGAGITKYHGEQRLMVAVRRA